MTSFFSPKQEKEKEKGLGGCVSKPSPGLFENKAKGCGLVDLPGRPADKKMPDLQKAIKAIQRLEVKALPYREKIDCLYERCSPNGGMNNGGMWDEASGKLYRLAEQKAVVWNEIRNLIIDKESLTSLWQAAVKAGYDVATYGKEEYLKITSQQITDLLPVQQQRN